MMNSSDRQVSPRQCSFLIFLGGRLDSAATEYYRVVVFVAILNIITCPITIVLNSLVIVAVHTKPRLKTMSNIALDCLASTDLVMGVVGQPLFLAQMITILQADASDVNCLVMELPRHVVRLLADHTFSSDRQNYLLNCQQYSYVLDYRHYHFLSSCDLLRNASPQKTNRCPASLSGSQAKILKGEEGF